MSTPYIGEIRMTGFDFEPLGWAFCDGQLMAIEEFSALFSLIGTTYGGDGVNFFALPDLQGRIPFHQGAGAGQMLELGQVGGEESVTLTTKQIPEHTHALAANAASGNQSSPSGGFWAASSLGQYSTEAASHTMSANALGSAGQGQPHNNLPPFLAVTFIISLNGIYPSQD